MSANQHFFPAGPSMFGVQIFGVFDPETQQVIGYIVDVRGSFVGGLTSWPQALALAWKIQQQAMQRVLGPQWEALAAAIEEAAADLDLAREAAEQLAAEEQAAREDAPKPNPPPGPLPGDLPDGGRGI